MQDVLKILIQKEFEVIDKITKKHDAKNLKVPVRPTESCLPAFDKLGND